MHKYPFTQRGVTRALEMLYQLPDEKLYTVAQKLQQDPICWIHKHFIIAELQAASLAKLPQKLVYTASNQLSTAIYNRLPVILNVAAFPDKNWLVEQINVIGITETKYATTAIAKGSLTISIHY